jgi:hypothetical protein
MRQIHFLDGEAMAMQFTVARADAPIERTLLSGATSSTPSTGSPARRALPGSAADPDPIHGRPGCTPAASTLPPRRSMRIVRLFFLFAGLVLASGCSSDLLPIRDEDGTWLAQEVHGTGPDQVTIIHGLAFSDDGSYEWTRTVVGDGAGHPSARVHTLVMEGWYRIRGRFLDLQAISMKTAHGDNTDFVPLVVEPAESGNHIMIRVEDDVLTLIFATGNGSPLVFERLVMID